MPTGERRVDRTARPASARPARTPGGRAVVPPPFLVGRTGIGVLLRARAVGWTAVRVAGRVVTDGGEFLLPGATATTLAPCHRLSPCRHLDLDNLPAGLPPYAAQPGGAC